MATRISKKTKERQRKNRVTGRRTVSLKQAQASDRKRRGKTSSGKTSASKNARLLTIHGSDEAKARNKALAEATGKSRTSQSGLHQANLNRNVLAEFGSPEAQARNAELPSALSGIGEVRAGANMSTVEGEQVFTPPPDGDMSRATASFEPSLEGGADTTGAGRNVFMDLLMNYFKVDELPGADESGNITSDMRLEMQLPGGGALKTGAKASFNNMKALLDDVPAVGRTSTASKAGGLLNLNTKTRSLIKKTLIGSGLGVTATIYAMKALDTKLWGQHLQGEAYEGAQFALDEAREIGESEGDWSLHDELISGMEEAENLDSSGFFNTVFPWVYAGKAAVTKANNLATASEVYNRYGELRKTVAENGGDPNGPEFWSVYQEQKTTDETRVAELWLNNREKYLAMEQAAKAQNRKEDAAYWAAQQKASFEQEKRMLALREEYWKRVRELQQREFEKNTPSRLNFGLI